MKTDALPPNGPLVIGLDIGATKIAGALIKFDGTVVAGRQVETRTTQGSNWLIHQIVQEIDHFASRATSEQGGKNLPLLGVGIGIPGQVNSQTGIVREAVNLNWNEIHLVAELEKRLDHRLPIFLETDANASTLGEFYFGAAQGFADFAYLTIGSGFGAGVYLNGKLLTGHTWKAAELGHYSLDPHGHPCVCGLRGCAETLISGPALIQLASSLQERNGGQHASPDLPLTPPAILSAARQGDELALAALAEMGRNLGIIIAICVAVLNPALVVIGGGLGLAAFDLILPAAWNEIRLRTLPSANRRLEILPSAQESSALGPASLVLDHLKSAPLPFSGKSSQLDQS